MIINIQFEHLIILLMFVFILGLFAGMSKSQPRY